MPDPCQPLPWDSEFFGFPVARVVRPTLTEADSRDVLAWCSAHGTRLLYFLSENDVRSWAAAVHAGFRPVDIRVELGITLDAARPATEPVPSGILLRESRPADVNDLLPIATDVHSQSRYFADPAVPRDKAHELFAVWIRRSVQHEIADVVFVAELDGRPVSYLTVGLADRVATIGLVGVGPEARGRRIGVAMVQAALAWSDARGAHEVVVATQGGNIAAQCLYQRCGFLTASTRLWFHRWFA